MYGEYEFEARGKYIARVRLRVDYEDDQLGRELLVDFDPNIRDWHDWRMAVHFGLAYVWDAWLNIRRTHVHVLEIYGHGPFDSPRLVIAYAASFAFLQAISWQPPRVPSINLETGEFVFPRWMHEIQANQVVVDITQEPIRFLPNSAQER